MKACVFGGSGFLGSHVADVLVSRGYDVTIFDSRASVYLQKGEKMIVGSILDKDAVYNAIEGCDVVYNFAGIADIDEAKNKPIQTVEVNILGNTIILDACRSHGVKRFVFASSVYVYSDSGSFYRSSKQACELIIENFHEAYGLSYTILRYGSLYGPRADERNWIFRILKQAITEEKITREGDGEELREYIHVEDAARCSVDILSKEYENEYVILTGYQQLKIRNLMVMIREMLGNRIELEFLPNESNVHYEITPYSFNPRIAKKLVSHHYLDMGQGLLQCLKEIYKKEHHYEELNGVMVEGDQ
ncbi:NAD-dependent epimerase/dehydratase family protein [Methanolobus psychrotolerans]|uniref:NAD-dependent epimerase/dehydratase family protein n=1 Tax=Methanolobus psychrotolerans TaxID=1874706 RepID=UPI000B91CD4B|nr:NAD(P)-dependent oxidoreductase [Methanolobus psychrotolerans]